LNDGHIRRMSYDSAGLPSAFRNVVDRPLLGEIAVLPVPGSERVIAIIYLDNGARDRPVGDIEIFELAAFQLGLALENEFLRRSGPKQGTGGPAIRMRTMG
jgi:GAF domain-containing protein